MDDLLAEILQLMESGEQLDDELLDLIEQLLQSEITTPPIPPTPPITEGAELLWILAGGEPDAFVNYLRTYPDAALNSILRNPSQLRSLIARLEEEMPKGSPGQEDGVEQAPINSSNIYGFNYDPKTGTLRVRFQGGSIYQYQGVPGGVFRVFQQGAVPAKTSGKNEYGEWWEGKLPSLGAAFYEMIRKGGYPYQRLS